MSEWQTVYTSKLLHKAEIVKAVLEEHNLNPIIIDKQDSLYKIGYFEVMVNPDEILRAIKIIDNEINIE
jgi:hypothetical protein